MTLIAGYTQRGTGIQTFITPVEVRRGPAREAMTSSRESDVTSGLLVPRGRQAEAIPGHVRPPSFQHQLFIY